MFHTSARWLRLYVIRRDSMILWNRLANRQDRHSRIGVAFVSGVILTVCGLLTACGKSDATQAPMGLLPVSVIRVEPSNVPLSNEWVGTMDGYVNAQIQPQVSGYLVAQRYREGAVVEKGQVLFQIDPRPSQALLDQAQAQLGQAQAQAGQAEAQVEQTEGALGQAQAQLALAKINLQRDTPLAAQRAIAQSTLDNEKQQEMQQESAVKAGRASVAAAQAAVAAAKAAVGGAQAAVETAKLNLGFTEVRSLIAGIAGQATTQVGNLVSPQSVLTSVSQMDPIKVYFSLSDAEYLALAKRANTGGADLLKGASNVPLTLHLSDGSTYPHPGQIVFVDRQMNQQTGAIRIAAAFSNPGNVLRPGQFGRIAASTGIQMDAILVPQAVVTDLQGQKQVFTVDADDKVHVANVTLGSEVGSSVVVLSGLHPGTMVVADNLQKLREGMPVAPHASTAALAASQPAGGN
jgi:membrane fusion protein (multidrug efflux system)